MEVKAGYKQTEVGAIPKEWDFVPLSDLITEFRGGAPFKPSDFTKAGVRVLPKGAVGRTGWLRIEEDDVQYCSPSYAATHRNNQVDERYTIVVLRDLVPSGPSIGLIVQIGQPDKFVLAQGVYGFKTNSRGNPGYLVHLSNTRWYRHLMNSIMVGSTQVHITNTAFRRAKIPLPPSPEQRVIADALSDVNGLLDGLDRLIAKKRDLKQAAMQQLLTGQTRLPGFHGEWETKELGKLGKISGAGVDKKIRPGEQAVRLLNYMDVYHRNFISSKDLAHVVSASVEQAARCAVRIGDIFFTPSSEMPFDIAVSAVAAEDIPDACYSYHVVRLRLEEDWALNFRAYAFKTQSFIEQAARMCEGSGVRYVITQAKFRQLTVRYPLDKAEQTAIANVLTAIDLELAALEKRREKSRTLKQGMMQELLTGRTRLV